MYRIVYIHKDTTTENPIFIPGDDTYTLTAGKLSMGCGLSGELSIDIPDTNPAKTEIVCLTDEVIFYRNDEELWRGRPVTIQMDFDLTGTLTCEGCLSYLYDTWYPPFEWGGSPKDLLQDVLDNHNAQVEDRKKIYLGDVTVVDSNDYIPRSSESYLRTLDLLFDKFSGSSLGGYLRIRMDGDKKYLDYLETYATTASQRIELGVNLLDLADTVDYGELITALLPLGEKDEETGKYLTVESVNNGSVYIYDEDAVAQYGWICGSANWDDVTLPENLLKKAQDYLLQMTAGVRSLEVKAVDLTLAGEDVDAINLGDSVLVRSLPHGVNQWIELVEMDIDPINPANDTLIFGATSASYTGTAKTTERQTIDSIDRQSTYIRNLSAEFVTTEYLSANYATFEYVDSVVINAGLVTTEYLEANYATIKALEAANATIAALDATAAEIMSLLAGNAGVGDLQAIHLTSDNVVIDNAIITDAMIFNVSADKLTSGTIYTSLVTIQTAEDDASLYITNSTMQFTDTNGVVRVQIGEDAQGDYNIYILNAEEDVLFDALGLTEAGVSGNGGIIKNVAVADDANIAGYKLDIDSVASYLNESGDIIVSAAQVTIGDTTLSAWYTDINTRIDGLDAGGVIKFTTYYALGGSNEEPPTFPGEDIIPAYVGTAQVGYSRVGILDSIEGVWTTERLIADEGQYLWIVYYLEFMDGHTEWSTPTCLTDGYVRTQTSVMQTELTVVQGQITEKVWQTDINEAISPIEDDIIELHDQYALLQIDLGQVTIMVGDLTSKEEGDYLEVSSQIASLVVNVDEITTTVAQVEENIDGVQESLQTEIKQLAGSISLTATSNTNGTASIILSVDGEDQGTVTAVTEARTAFANDNTSITISAGTITFNSGTFVVNSTYFKVTSTGVITATSGTIGCFTLGSSSLYTTSNSFNSVSNNIYIGSSGISLGTTFSVTPAGELTSTSGTIGGWTITSSYLSSGPTSVTDGTSGILLSGSAFVANYGGSHVRIYSGSIDCTAFITDTWLHLNYSMYANGNWIYLNSSNYIYYSSTWDGIYMRSTTETYHSGDMYIMGSLSVYGTKNRAVKTKHYGEVALCAFETASAHFADIGSGTIGDDGKVTIFFDPEFAETIDLDCEYQVLLTQTSAGKVEYAIKDYDYFTVYGEPGATFDWMVCAYQRDYTSNRLEPVYNPGEPIEKELDADKAKAEAQNADFIDDEDAA